MENQNKNKVEKLVEKAIGNLNEFGGKQVAGEPFVNQLGQTIIPISNVTTAVFSGGGEYGDVKISKEIGSRFAGGDFTICSVKPTYFIIDNGVGFTVTKTSDELQNLVAILNKLIEKL